MTTGVNGTNLFSWLLMLQQNKLECLYWLFSIKLKFVSNNMTSLDWKGLPGTNTLANLPPHQWRWKMFCSLNLFTLSLILQPNMLECLYWLFSTKLIFVRNNMTSLGWKGLPGTNTPANFATMFGKKKAIYLITLTTLLSLILRIRILLGSGRSRIGSGGSSQDPYTPIRWACLKTWPNVIKHFTSVIYEYLY